MSPAGAIANFNSLRVLRGIVGALEQRELDAEDLSLLEFHFQKLVSVSAKQAGEATIRSTEPEAAASSLVNKLTNSLGLTLV